MRLNPNWNGSSWRHALWSRDMPWRVFLWKDEREPKLGSYQLWQPVLCPSIGVPKCHFRGMEWHLEYVPAFPLLLYVFILHPSCVHWGLFLAEFDPSSNQCQIYRGTQISVAFQWWRRSRYIQTRKIRWANYYCSVYQWKNLC